MCMGVWWSEFKLWLYVVHGGGGWIWRRLIEVVANCVECVWECVVVVVHIVVVRSCGGGGVLLNCSSTSYLFSFSRNLRGRGE